MLNVVESFLQYGLNLDVIGKYGTIQQYVF